MLRRQFSVAVLVCITSGLLASSYHVMTAADPLSDAVARQSDQTGGAMNCAQTVGHIVWLCSGPRLLAIDVTDPTAPRVHGRTDVLSGIIHALAIETDRPVAWVAAGSGVTALDLRDTHHPVVMSHTALVEDPERLTGRWKLALAAERLWVVGDPLEPLHGLDITDPRSPVSVSSQLSTDPQHTSVLGIATAGGRLYAVGRFPGLRSPIDGLPIAGVAVVALEPNVDGALVVMAATAVPTGFEAPTADLIWDSGLLRVIFQGQQVRVVSFRESANGLSLARFDTADPGGFVEAVIIQGGRLYGSWTWDEQTNLGVYVFDLRRPNSTRKLAAAAASLQDTGRYSAALAIAGDQLWVADEGGSVRGLNLADPQLGEIGRLSLVGVASAVSWVDRSESVIVAAGNILSVIDPEGLVTASVPVHTPGMTYVESDDDLVLAITKTVASGLRSQGFHIWALPSSGGAQEVLASNDQLAPLSSCGPSATMEGGSLLLAQESADGSFMAYWDLRSTSGPTEKNRWPGVPCTAMARSGNIAGTVYIDGAPPGSTDTWWFSVLDLSTGSRFNLSLGSAFGSVGLATASLAMVDRSAWIVLKYRVNGRWRLEVQSFDLSDPGSPALAGSWREDLVGSPFGPLTARASASGDRLFVACPALYPGDRGGRLIVFDSTDLTATRPLTSLPVGSSVEGLSVSEDGLSVAVAGGRYGLEVIQRPFGGWEAASPAPTVDPKSPTTAPKPSATMVVRSRSWIPSMGRP